MPIQHGKDVSAIVAGIVAFLTVASSVFVIMFPDVAFGLTCTVRNGGCNPDENEIFSMYATTNAHAAEAGHYDQRVCCDQITSALRGTCNADEAEGLSFYSTTNAHAAEAGHYDNRLCIKYTDYPADCTLKASCNGTNETCIASLSATTNSHVGDCDQYSNKLCCGLLSDLYVNQSSITTNDSTPVYGDGASFTTTVWNIGDRAAPQVNVSCYENGTYFDSQIINTIPPDTSAQTPRYANCTWTASCNNNVSVVVDPAGSIRELNESNNEAWMTMSMIERLTVAIDAPGAADTIYRGDTINLQSTITASCDVPSYSVTWYNASTNITVAEDTTWTIPKDDALLGAKTINATAASDGYIFGSDTVGITILNRPPNVTTPIYNATPTTTAEIERGNDVHITCDVSDTEDAADALAVEINVLDSNNVWDNETVGHITGTFFRNFSTTQGSALGTYTALCTANDTDSGHGEMNSTFLVWQNGTIGVDLNATTVGYQAGINVSGYAAYLDIGFITSSDVDVKIGGVTQCTDTTGANGQYDCQFTGPNQVGTFTVAVTVTDKDTSKVISNSTSFIVQVSYGEESSAESAARDVGCYEVPQLVQNPDGSITESTVRICVWE